MHYLGQYRRRGICLFTSSHWSLFVFAVWLTNPLGDVPTLPTGRAKNSTSSSDHHGKHFGDIPALTPCFNYVSY